MNGKADQGGGIFSITGRQWLILLMIQLSNILFGMTITIANLVLPQMRGTLSATQDEISWVITLNLVATAVATPMTGWLAARLGWRTLMFSTVLGFTASSILCGMAGSLETLIMFRVAQGAFGAPIMPMGQAVLLATFPPRLQPAALAMWGVGAIFGPVVGPIVGSWASDAYNWRAAFFIIVPPGLCALACIWFALSEHTERKSVRFDWIGFLALSTAMICAQLIFDRGQRSDWFESMEIVLYLFFGVLAFWIFVAHCLTAEQPFLNPRLLLDRNFDVGLILALVMGMLNFIGIVLFPSLLHDLRGYPDDSIGTLIAARGLGNWTAFAMVAQMTRRMPRLTIAIGLALQAGGAFWMSGFSINVTEAEIFWTQYSQGLGQSLAFTPITVMAFTTLPKEDITEASGVFTLMRNFGSSMFISLSVLVLVRSTSISYAEMSESITPAREAFILGWPSYWGLDSATGLLHMSAEIQRQAAMIGYINAFYMAALTAAVAIPLSAFMRAAKRPA